MRIILVCVHEMEFANLIQDDFYFDDDFDSVLSKLEMPDEKRGTECGKQESTESNAFDDSFDEVLSSLELPDSTNGLGNDNLNLLSDASLSALHLPGSSHYCLRPSVLCHDVSMDSNFEDIWVEDSSDSWLCSLDISNLCDAPHEATRSEELTKKSTSERRQVDCVNGPVEITLDVPTEACNFACGTLPCDISFDVTCSSTSVEDIYNGLSGDHSEKLMLCTEEADAAMNDFVAEPVYCICRRKESGTMIACDKPGCNIEWYHVFCVGVKEVPEGDWYCPSCTGR